MTRAGVTALALAAVSSVSLAAYQAGRYVSLNRGIQQTQNAIQQIDKVLEQDKAESDALLQKMTIDYSLGITSLGGDPLYIAKSVDAFKEGVSAFEATNAAQSREYGQAIQKTAEAIAGIWGQLDPRVKFGRALVDVAANAYEAQALLRRQAQLLETRLTLERQLSHLRAEDPNYQTDIEKILGNLQSDSDAQHQAFLRWLSDHGLSEKDVIAAALRDAMAAKPAAPGEIARGAVLLDPQNISAVASIPCVNQDFVIALEKGLSSGTLPGGFDAGVTTRHPVAGPYFGPVGPGGSASYYFLSPYSPDTYSTVPMFTDAPCGSTPTATSVAGTWSMLPGSYFTKEVLNPEELQQTRQDNAGYLFIQQIGPGHFQYGSFYVAVDLYGSDTKVSGEGTKTLTFTGVNWYTGKYTETDEITDHVDAELSDGKLYLKEMQKRKHTDEQRRVQVLYEEQYCICVPSGH